MNRELLVNLILVFIIGAMIAVLWPIIKWLAMVAILLVAMVIVYTMIKAKKIKKEIEKDPNAYYSAVDNSNKNVIDVEYKEKVVEEEK